MTIDEQRLRELAASPIADEALLAAELLAARETIERVTKERDREAREAAGYQKIAREAANAEEPGLLVLLVNQDGAEVRIFGPDRDAEERFGETVARWWNLVRVTSDCLEAEDRTKERDAARAERDRYHDALVARHGGEPIALLSELDEARAEAERLRGKAERMEKRHDVIAAIHEHMGDLFQVVGEWGHNPYIEERVEMLVKDYRAKVAECARVAKQRDELVRSLREVHERIRRGIAEHGSEGCEVFATLLDLHQLGPAACDAIAAEQPKPQGEGGAS